MTRGFIAIFFVVLLKGKGVTGLINNGPSNAVVKLGGQVIFNCTSSTNLQNWVFARSRDDLGTSSAQNIAVNCVIQSNFTAHYEVDRPGGSTNTCNLIVKATTMQQAGIYTCTDSALGPSAILTVIDHTPVFTSINMTAVEGEIVMFECLLKYSGTTEPTPTLRPYFYWTNSTGANITSYDDSTTNHTAVSQITVTAQRGNSITCHVYFILNPPTTPNYASNTPTVNSSATSSTFEEASGAVWKLVVSAVVPFIGGNCIFLVIYCVVYCNYVNFQQMMDNRYPVDNVKVVLLMIASVFCGLFLIPIAVTIALRNAPGQGVPIWMIVVMWICDIILLFPTSFVVVYFVDYI